MWTQDPAQSGQLCHTLPVIPYTRILGGSRRERAKTSDWDRVNHFNFSFRTQQQQQQQHFPMGRI